MVDQQQGQPQPKNGPGGRLTKKRPYPFEVRAELAQYAPAVESVSLHAYAAARAPRVEIEPGETLTFAQWRGRQAGALRQTVATARRELGLDAVVA